jgi:hypothetical protein
MFSLGAMPAAGFAGDLMQDAAMELLPWFEPRKKDPRSSTEAYLESWAAAGSFGLVSDLAWATYMAGESKQFANFFTPPGIGTLNDATAVAGRYGHAAWNYYIEGNAVKAELARGQAKSATRDFFRQFGGLGAAFGRYQFPTKHSQRRDQQSTLDEVEEWLDSL